MERNPSGGQMLTKMFKLKLGMQSRLDLNKMRGQVSKEPFIGSIITDVKMFLAVASVALGHLIIPFILFILFLWIYFQFT